MKTEEKLKALMRGLEIPNIEKFIKKAEVSDFETLGMQYANQARILSLGVPTVNAMQDTFKTLIRRGIL